MNFLLNEKLILLIFLLLKLIWFHEFLSVINTQIYLMFSICENKISCCKNNENENDFMENIYDPRILFWFSRIQGKNENIMNIFEFKLVDHHWWYKATSSLIIINLTMIFKLTAISLIVSFRCASVWKGDLCGLNSLVWI